MIPAGPDNKKAMQMHGLVIWISYLQNVFETVSFDFRTKKTYTGTKSKCNCLACMKPCGLFFAQRKGPPKRACHCCFFVCIGCGAGCLPVSFWVTDHSSRSLVSNSADVTVTNHLVSYAPPHRGIHHADTIAGRHISSQCVWGYAPL